MAPHGVGGPELALLAALAFATAALTAAVGNGGGAILLAAMLLYLEPVTAIPVHGAVQLVSNGSRAAIQRRHVRWSLLSRYAVGLVPMGLLGLAVVHAVPATAARAAIGAFVLLAVWAPRALLLGAHPERTRAAGSSGEGVDPGRRFLWLGCAAGFLNTTVGASGPLQGPFFLGLGLSRQGVVGSFAAAQVLGHTVKIVLFAAAGFAFASWVVPIAAMAACVAVGTWVGSQLLERMDERTFRWVYRIALTAVALRLCIEPVWRAV